MRYLALGDSMSIDLYTGVAGGGAASQFARRLPASSAQDLSRDGAMTHDALAALARLTRPPEIVTLTIGGNDLLGTALMGAAPTTPEAWRWRATGVVEGFRRIIHALTKDSSGVTIVCNTVYDPTDGDDARLAEMGLPLATRAGLEAYNAGVRAFADLWCWPDTHRLMLCDAERLFRGHGYWSRDPWITQMIEPNLAGATALCGEWLRLARAAGE